MIDLLQVSGVATTPSVAGDANQDGFLTLWELLTTGGWIMLPLGIMLLLAVYIFTERYLAIRAAGRIDLFDNHLDNRLFPTIPIDQVLQKHASLVWPCCGNDCFSYLHHCDYLLTITPLKYSAERTVSFPQQSSLA